MTDEAKRCVEALQDHRRTGFYLVGNIYATEIISLIESLSAELEQVKAERDAAVKDLKEFSYYPCLTCKHRTGVHYCEKFGERTPGREVNDVIFCGQYEWRGVQDDGVGADNETR